MFEKCIKCARIGESCVPNVMLLSFPDLVQWCIKRQKFLGWSNSFLAGRADTPVGTINRIWAGEYTDCYWSTMQHILIALFGGTSDEFSCTEMVERELAQKEEYERQAASLAVVEEENQRLKDTLSRMDEQHRSDVRAIRAEYLEQITWLKEELQAWRNLHQTK